MHQSHKLACPHATSTQTCVYVCARTCVSTTAVVLGSNNLRLMVFISILRVRAQCITYIRNKAIKAQTHIRIIFFGFFVLFFACTRTVSASHILATGIRGVFFFPRLIVCVHFVFLRIRVDTRNKVIEAQMYICIYIHIYIYIYMNIYMYIDIDTRNKVIEAQTHIPRCLLLLMMWYIHT